ncbi:hypothetical protein [Tepidiforma sp.]|uniref:hypothetical protein n=1 Tax=Tepidiforma sp. TaxID=2682230 RepID=UPI002ADD7626|nr:hypothetical protein [Tepidiforma sp.]
MALRPGPTPVIDGPEHEPAGLPAPDEIIVRMRQAIASGQHWFEALLDAVGRWRLPEEVVDGRHYRYLIANEAFDWLLLAERLLDAAADLVPPAEREALLWSNRWPEDLEIDDAEFARRIGPAKYSAHLNYLYGILVEEALQLAVEEEIHKEIRARVWGFDQRVDETMYQRIYGKTRDELLALHYQETGTIMRGHVSLGDWKAFTYWLFKHRLKSQDRARIASDTRKGLAQLTRMEHAVRDRRHGAPLDDAIFAARYTA